MDIVERMKHDAYMRGYKAGIASVKKGDSTAHNTQRNAICPHCGNSLMYYEERVRRCSKCDKCY